MRSGTGSELRGSCSSRVLPDMGPVGRAVTPGRLPHAPRASDQASPARKACIPTNFPVYALQRAPKGCITPSKETT
jgi:hypothetical protein